MYFLLCVLLKTKSGFSNSKSACCLRLSFFLFSYSLPILSLLFVIICLAFLSPQDDFSRHGGFVQARASNSAGSLRSCLAVRRRYVSYYRRRRSISRRFRGVCDGSLVTHERRHRRIQVFLDVQPEKAVVQSIFCRDARIRIVPPTVDSTGVGVTCPFLRTQNALES